MEIDISYSFQIERNTMLETIRNQTEFRLVYNKKEIIHYDHIPHNLKGIRNIFLRVYACIYPKGFMGIPLRA